MWATQWLTDFLTSMRGSMRFVFGALMGAMAAFDFGEISGVKKATNSMSIVANVVSDSKTSSDVKMMTVNLYLLMIGTEFVSRETLQTEY